MKIVKAFTILIGAWAASAGPSQAQQPPDVVQSDASQNTAMGTGALLNLQCCVDSNTAAGFGALHGNTTGSSNTATGTLALYTNTVGNRNTAMGHDALSGNTSGDDNTASGEFALGNNATGYTNTAFGSSALRDNEIGYSNTAVGAQALYSNTSGIFNTALGTDALYSNVDGIRNTASGLTALYSNTIGNGNVAAGFEALYYNITGNNNSGGGYQALVHNTTGAENTAYGDSALYSNSSGSGNIALGANAGSLITGSNNIDIGNSGSAADNEVIRIGAASTQKSAFIAGIATSKITGSAVYVTAGGRLGVLASSERYKTAVSPMGETTEKLRQLRPVKFHLKAEPRGAVQYGLIAEEVDKVYPELVIHDAAGKIQGVRYDELAPMLLNEVQHLESRLSETRRDLTELRRLNQSMQSAILKLQAINQRVAMR